MKTRKLQEAGLLRKSPTESSSYTSQSTDDVDIERALDRRDDCYRIPAQLTEPRKKHIIITNPSIRYGIFPYQVDDDLKMWSSLLDQGFAISVWTENGLVRVKNVKELKKIIMKVEPIQHRDLIKKLAKQNMSSDDCYLAGIGETQELLHVLLDKEPSKNFDVSKLNKLTMDERDKLLSCMSEQLFGLYFDQKSLSDIHKAEYQEYLKTHPKISIEPIKNFQSLSTILNYCKELVEITIDKGCFNIPENIHFPATVKKVIFGECEFTGEDIFKLIKNCHLLEELDIRVWDVRVFPENINKFPYMKNLRIWASDITWEQLKKLIDQCPMLEHIDLYDCDKLGEMPPNFYFPASLKTIKFNRCPVSWKLLEGSFKNCHQLEKLDLRDNKELGDVPPGMKLPATLKELNLNKTDISLKQLQVLLRDNRALEKIDLHGCQNLDKELFQYSLPDSTKEIILDASTINWLQLKTLLKNCQQLEKISLTMCNELKENMPDDVSLPASLKELSFTYSNRTWPEIIQLIKNCSTLERLDISCSKLTTDIPQDYALPDTLKELDLSVTKVGWNEIAGLLRNAKSLQSLKLRNCKKLGQIPDSFSLPVSVSHLQLWDQELSSWGDLARLLKNCNEIRYLELDQHSKMDRLPKDISFFSKIVYISIPEGGIHKDDIARLRAEYPDLKFGFDNEQKTTPSGGLPSKRGLDSDTGAKDTTLYGDQVFDDKVVPNYYRKQVMDDIVISAEDVSVKLTQAQIVRTELSRPTIGAKITKA